MPDEGRVLQGRCVIGLDLSLTSTGIVSLVEVGKDWGVHSSLHVGHSLKRDAAVREKIERYVVIAAAVLDTVRQFKGMEVTVGIEGYAYSKKGAQNDLAELQGIVKSQLWLGERIEPVIVSVTEARKLVLGTGSPKGSKKGKTKEGVAKILKGMGLEFDSDDEADAYVIAKCVAMNLEPRQPELLLG